MSNSLSDQAYASIQKQILSGQLAVGAQVSELSLAQQIGISRTPVREAVRRLVAEGLLEQVPRFGTIVRTPDRHDIAELYEVREALESWAAAEAAGRLKAEDLASLKQLEQQMRAIAKELAQSDADQLDAGQLRRFLAADMAFHALILRATGNQRLMKMIAEHRVLSRIFRNLRQDHDAEVVACACDHHREIHKALASGDSEAARQSMAQHIRESKRRALAAFDQRSNDALRREIPLDLPADLLQELDRMEGVDLSEKGASA